MLEAREDVTYSVSATTRPMRAGEQQDVDYHFLSRPDFERRREAGEFLEWAEYGGNLYGTLRAEVERGLAAGKHVVLDIEVAGARQVRQRFPNSVQVFVLPPSAAELVTRLLRRNTDEPAVVGQWHIPTTYYTSVLFRRRNTHGAAMALECSPHASATSRNFYR